MNPDYKPDDASPASESPTFDVSSSGTSNEATPATNDAVTDQLQQVWGTVSNTLGELPAYVSSFFKEYRRPLITVGLLFAAIVSVKLVLAILGAINEVPLLAPFFEIIGLTYSGWFLYRYLLKASNRQELFEDINSIKDQVLGKKA